VADEVKQLRERLGLTIDQLAKELGVTARTVYRWESGASDPHPIYLARLQAMAYPVPDLKKLKDDADAPV